MDLKYRLGQTKPSASITRKHSTYPPVKDTTPLPSQQRVTDAHDEHGGQHPREPVTDARRGTGRGRRRARRGGAGAVLPTGPLAAASLPAFALVPVMLRPVALRRPRLHAPPVVLRPVALGALRRLRLHARVVGGRRPGDLLQLDRGLLGVGGRRLDEGDHGPQHRAVVLLGRGHDLHGARVVLEEEPLLAVDGPGLPLGHAGHDGGGVGVERAHEAGPVGLRQRHDGRVGGRVALGRVAVRVVGPEDAVELDRVVGAEAEGLLFLVEHAVPVVEGLDAVAGHGVLERLGDAVQPEVPEAVGELAPQLARVREDGLRLVEVRLLEQGEGGVAEGLGGLVVDGLEGLVHRVRLLVDVLGPLVGAGAGDGRDLEVLTLGERLQRRGLDEVVVEVGVELAVFRLESRGVDAAEAGQGVGLLVAAGGVGEAVVLLLALLERADGRDRDRLHDGALDQARVVVTERGEEHGHRRRAGRVARHDHVIRVSSELCGNSRSVDTDLERFGLTHAKEDKEKTYSSDVFLQPLQPLDLVLQAVVQARPVLNLLALQETIGPDAVVDLDHQNVSKHGQIAAVEVGVGEGLEAPALDEVQDRQLRLGRRVGRREDVEVQAVLVGREAFVGLHREV
ncbi:hypothetical protein CGRA01v4_08936 [Colletotrichum graminicola]|nr:hypothetical protein CGRA01v4_08936 [Colletotrichum graminicola]